MVPASNYESLLFLRKSFFVFCVMLWQSLSKLSAGRGVLESQFWRASLILTSPR
jgi:hypothetical protein